MTVLNSDPGIIDIWGAGQLDVLSVGQGHLTMKLTEDSTEEEVAHVRKTIEEMMSRGFAIFVEDEDGTQHRVRKFHPDKMTYVIEETQAQKKDKAKAKAKAEKEVPVSKTKATAVGRSAGG